jgi:hypothetical protein
MGRRGRVKSRMRLVASNVLRERRGETPREFDHWKALCVGLAVVIVVCLIIAGTVIGNLNAEFPNRFIAVGDPAYEKRNDEVMAIIEWPLIFSLFGTIMLIPSSLGYLSYRVQSGAALGMYAAELGCIKQPGFMTAEERARCAEKMGFSEKDVSVLSRQRKKMSEWQIVLIITAIGTIIVCLLVLPGVFGLW